MKLKLVLLAVTFGMLVLVGHTLVAETFADAGLAMSKEPEAKTLLVLGAALLMGAALLRRVRVRN